MASLSYVMKDWAKIHVLPVDMEWAAAQVEALESDLRIAEQLCCEHCPNTPVPSSGGQDVD